MIVIVSVLTLLCLSQSTDQDFKGWNEILDRLHNVQPAAADEGPSVTELPETHRKQVEQETPSQKKQPEAGDHEKCEDEIPACDQNETEESAVVECASDTSQMADGVDSQHDENSVPICGDNDTQDAQPHTNAHPVPENSVEEECHFQESSSLPSDTEIQSSVDVESSESSVGVESSETEEETLSSGFSDIPKPSGKVDILFLIQLYP